MSFPNLAGFTGDKPCKTTLKIPINPINPLKLTPLNHHDRFRLPVWSQFWHLPPRDIGRDPQPHCTPRTNLQAGFKQKLGFNFTNKNMPTHSYGFNQRTLEFN
jgi:hypothetical protein